MKIRSLFVLMLVAGAFTALRCGGTSNSGADAAVAPDADVAGLDAGPVPDAGPKCDPAKCAPGNICVQDRCMLACARHTDCPDGYDCRSVESQLVCVANQMPVDVGQFGTGCGLDPTVCADGFVCIGGQGTPAAYCTRASCADDTECPGNYYCATMDVAAPRDGGVADTGPKHDGSVETPNYVVAQMCVKRNFCAPASALVDCNDPQALLRTDSHGRSYCLKTCSGLDPNGCGGGNGCLRMDGGYECWPRAMTCATSHSFCSRCTSSKDCPAKSYCTDTGSGEPYCTKPCWLNADCVWPGMPADGNQGVCYMFDDGEHQCLAAQSSSEDGAPASCWKPMPTDGGT